MGIVIDGLLIIFLFTFENRLNCSNFHVIERTPASHSLERKFKFIKI